MRRGRLLTGSRRHQLVDGLKRPSGRNASPSGITPSHIMSPAPEPTRGSRTEVRLGARAHTIQTCNRAHAPPPTSSSNPDNPDPALDTGPPAQVRILCRLTALLRQAAGATLGVARGRIASPRAVSNRPVRVRQSWMRAFPAPAAGGRLGEGS